MLALVSGRKIDEPGFHGFLVGLDQDVLLSRTAVNYLIHSLFRDRKEKGSCRGRTWITLLQGFEVTRKNHKKSPFFTCIGLVSFFMVFMTNFELSAAGMLERELCGREKF